MDAQEVKDRLQAVINSLIKDQPEDATKDLHDVLAAKMRDRISPEDAVTSDSEDFSDDIGDGDEVSEDEASSAE